MSIRNVILVLFSLVLVGATLVTAQQNTESDPQSVRDLMEEREAVLQRLVEFTKAAYSTGSGTLESAIAAQSELLAAQLEAATTPRERIGIRESQLEHAKWHEKVAANQVAVGNGSSLDLLKAKANRLTAQIHLQRERTE